jgi:hypothetical protein
MSILFVGYDLNKPGQDYQPLFNKIKELANGYSHSLDSTWLVGSKMTTAQFRDALLPFIDNNDELLVMDVTGDAAAWRGFDSAASDWFKKNLGQH